TTDIHPLSLHDALPISAWGPQRCPLLAHASTDALAPVLGHPLGSPRRSRGRAPLATESLAEGSVRVSRRPTCGAQRAVRFCRARSEEHTSELQSLAYLV